MGFKYTFRTNYFGRTFPEVSFKRLLHLEPTDLSWMNKEYLTVGSFIINYFNKNVFFLIDGKKVCILINFYNNYIHKNIMFLFITNRYLNKKKKKMWALRLTRCIVMV